MRRRREMTCAGPDIISREHLAMLGKQADQLERLVDPARLFIFASGKNTPLPVFLHKITEQRSLFQGLPPLFAIRNTPNKI